MTLNAKIGGFMYFLAISGFDTIKSISFTKVAPRYYRYAIQIENLIVVY